MARRKPRPIDQVIYALVLKHRDRAAGDGKSKQDEVLDYVVPPIEKAAKTIDGALPYLARFYSAAMVPDGKASRTGAAGKGSSPQYTFFDLDGYHGLHYHKAPLFKHLGKFTLFDGDQFDRQKENNYHAAGLVLQKWRWEWALIRPVLVAHPDWLYEDAYEHLRAIGGIPTIPVFDKPKRPRRGATG